MNFTISEIQINIGKEDLLNIARDLSKLGFDDRTQDSDDFIEAVESICKIEIPRQRF